MLAKSVNSMCQPGKARSSAAMVAISLIFGLTCYAMLSPHYTGNHFVLFSFVLSSVLLVVIACTLHPSFFVVALAAFLTLGFLLKTIAHLVFEIALIEPTGGFSGSALQWDTALTFAAAGQFGGAASIAVASLTPSLQRRKSLRLCNSQRLKNILLGTLALLLVIATFIYALNWKYMILRIGYPLGININPKLYAVLAFILTWGALLGSLTLIQWLIGIRHVRYSSLIIVSSFLGFLASVTMGSRAQFILYILVSICILVWQRRDIQYWMEVIVALCLAGLVFVLSIAVVSIERNYAFQGGGPQQQTFSSQAARQTFSANGNATTRASSSSERTTLPSKVLPIADPMTPDSRAPTINFPSTSIFGVQATTEESTLLKKIAVVTEAHRLGGLLYELRSLIVMRWIGLEGVLTTASAKSSLGLGLFMRGLIGDPAAGKDGIYQQMSGDRYGQVEVFTFLTLPGVVGFSSYSGSILVIFGFVFATVLAGHLLEWFAGFTTGNVAACAVSGVSLAYLTVQMGFPWTLFIYGLELALACSALGAFRILIRRMTKSTE
jgi:hypothetical protein